MLNVKTGKHKIDYTTFVDARISARVLGHCATRVTPWQTGPPRFSVCDTCSQSVDSAGCDS